MPRLNSVKFLTPARLLSNKSVFFQASIREMSAHSPTFSLLNTERDRAHKINIGEPVFLQKRSMYWGKLLDTWGETTQAEPNNAAENPYDIKPIEKSLEEVKLGLDKVVNQPVLKLMQAHNSTVREINDAVQSRKLLIFTRSDTEKQKMILSQLEKIRDFYIEFCSSKHFSTMEKELGSFMTTIIGSSSSIGKKIQLLKDAENKCRNSAKYLDMKKPGSEIRFRALNDQATLHLSAISALTKYKELIDNLPEKLKTAEITVQGFLVAAESNKELLITACDTMRLLRDIQRGVSAINALQQMDAMREDIEQCQRAIGEVVVTLSKGIEAEIDRKRSEIQSDHELESDSTKPKSP